MVRDESDRLRNIVVLGVNTYAWTFQVRGQPVPGPMPELRLMSPSGTVWQFGDPQQGSHIEGTAVEFCQVVTQTRHVADTALQVAGDVARAWMANAQCFAGAASTPPVPGSRYRVT
jgi:uncharacterized protein (TIGR03084 family)